MHTAAAFVALTETTLIRVYFCLFVGFPSFLGHLFEQVIELSHSITIFCFAILPRKKGTFSHILCCFKPHFLCQNVKTHFLFFYNPSPSLFRCLTLFLVLFGFCHTMPYYDLHFGKTQFFLSLLVTLRPERPLH